MTRKTLFLTVLLVPIFVVSACSRKNPKPQVVVEIPGSFTGNFVLEMGVRGASPLPTEATGYLITVPGSGKLQTSTLLEHPNVVFRNRGQGRIWGYSQRVFTTGDGIAIGGHIEFFVGTQQEFEAEQNKKNKSGGFLQLELVSAAA